MDMTKNARKQRYNEFLQLRGLPFLSKEQSKRLIELTKQRKQDNYYAFQCARVK